MSSFFKFSEVSKPEGPLLKMAKEKSGIEVDFSILDRPITKQMELEKIDVETASFSKEMESKTKNDDTETKNDGLTDKQKDDIRKKHPDWPDEIIDAISSWEEYEIYDKADLKVAYINDRPCLVRKDINLDYVDPKTGKTNRELMKDGRSPIDAKTGEKIELHHIGQKSDGPLVELTVSEHRGKNNGNFGVLHNSTKESEIDRNQFNVEKSNHWKTRIKET